MVKRLVCLWVWLIASAIPSLACNTCGCASGGGALGILPANQRNVAGLFFQYQQVSTYTDGALHGTMQSAQLIEYASLSLNKSWNVQVSIPQQWSVLKDYTEDQTSLHQDFFLGDVQLWSRYTTTWTSDTTTTHLLALLGGIELPTGAFEGDYAKMGMPASYYPGSASWDPLLGVQYIRMGELWTMVHLASLRISTPNKMNYTAGLKWHYSGLVTRKWGRWAPFLGLGTDVQHADKMYQLKQEASAWQIAYILNGFEYAFKSGNIGYRQQWQFVENFYETGTISPWAFGVYVNFFLR